MVNLSLREVSQAQLSVTQIVDGQLVFCKDTGNLYRDVGSRRVQAGSDIEFVSELPLAPIAGKIYCLLDGKMWGCGEDGGWIQLNENYTEITNTEIDEILNS